MFIGRVSAAVLGLLLIAAVSAARADDRALRRQMEEMRTEARVALVIGNSDYASSPLKNPVNDARLMAKILKGLGFDVIEVTNANQKQMKMAIDEFGDRIRNGGVGLFYYAGHGMQVKGENYLIPLGANIGSEREVEYEGVQLGRVLAQMHDAGNRLNIVMLDACRDNPFARSFRSGATGLATVDAPRGTFIAYATAPGSVAADGDGSNGVFTEQFAQAIQSEGLEIDRVFRQVRAGVMQKTGERQIPWTSSSLVGDFYFRMSGDAAQGPAGTQAPASAEGQEPGSEIVFWNSIKDSGDPDMFRAYLRQYPSGSFAELAHVRIQKLEGAARQAMASPPAALRQQLERFIDSGNGTVIANTGHVWQQKDDGRRRAFLDADAYCRKLLLGGYDDWRLPLKEELATLIDSSQGRPAISLEFFPATHSSPYWSSSRSASPAAIGVAVSFSSGNANEYDETEPYYVRCVRDAQASNALQ